MKFPAWTSNYIKQAFILLPVWVKIESLATRSFWVVDFYICLGRKPFVTIVFKNIFIILTIWKPSGFG